MVYCLYRVLGFWQMNIQYSCDYCGGYKGDVENFENPKPIDTSSGEVYAILVNDGNGNQRGICPKCLIKVFDSVLGEPKKGE